MWESLETKAMRHPREQAWHPSLWDRKVKEGRGWEQSRASKEDGAPG